MTAVKISKRYVSWNEFGRLADKLVQKINSEEKSVDLVVGVARGGIPLALVVADRLRVHIDFINVKSYDGIELRRHPKILSTLIENISDKNVLIVDDLVDEGDTMETMKNHLSTMKPRRIKTAVLFIKPWSKFTPDYYLQVVSQWIVFPWEIGEFGPK